MSSNNRLITGEDLMHNWLEEISNKLNNFDKASKASNLLFENKISEKVWLTSKEVACYLGKSAGAVRNMVSRGQLKPKKLGGRLYFSRTEIDRAIDASK